MSTIGTVVAVSISTDQNAVFVDVGLSPNREMSDIKFRQPSSAVWLVPKVGDMVEVSEIGSGEKVAHSTYTSREQSIPENLSEGDIAIEVADGTILRMNAETGDVTLSCSGDLNLDAANIYVGDEASAEPVATGTHTHQESGGGTTGEPSDVTTHEME